MTEEHQLPSDSDEDDEDYVPEAPVDSVSEAESEGEAESGQEESENDENKRRANKRRRKGKTKRVGKKSSEKVVVEEEEEEKKLTEEEEKKRADSLWADFMKDTGTPASGPSPQPPKLDSKPNEKIKVTKVFEFAGEEIKVEKEVSINSTEAIATDKTETTGRPARGRGIKRGGISSLLGQLGKRAKISTLEKSKLDWDNYKKEENLEEEISTHNRGKGGYLERQDFLQRADLRQFEIEKQMRSASRRNR